MTILEMLGIEETQLSWHDLAQCKGMDRELFYDKYESDENVAKMIDEVCLSCPVLQDCLLQGIENGEHGVWGGVFLTSGKMDVNKNAHKTQEVWDELRDRIGDVI